MGKLINGIAFSVLGGGGGGGGGGENTGRFSYFGTIWLMCVS